MLFNNVVPDLNSARVVVIVFHQPGCGACDEYLPRFKRIAARYASCIPVVILDCTDERFVALADRFKIRNTPTTLAVRKPSGAIRIDGSAPDAEIEQLFVAATRALSCGVNRG